MQVDKIMKRKKVMSYIQGSIHSIFKEKLRELKELKSCSEDYGDFHKFTIKFNEKRLVENSVRELSLRLSINLEAHKKCIKDFTRFVDKHGDEDMKSCVENLLSKRWYFFAVDRLPYVLFTAESDRHNVPTWRLERYSFIAKKWKEYCLSCLPPVASFANLGGLFRF